MLWKCCTHYAIKFGKLNGGYRTGKVQFSFPSQRKAMPKNVQATTQLHLFHILAVHGVMKSWTQLRNFPFNFYFHALEKEMATYSSVLAWRIPGMREPVRLPFMGLHRVGHDWSDLAAAAALLAETQIILCLAILFLSKVKLPPLILLYSIGSTKYFLMAGQLIRLSGDMFYNWFHGGQASSWGA